MKKIIVFALIALVSTGAFAQKKKKSGGKKLLQRQQQKVF